jgi:hypothetical protein
MIVGEEVEKREDYRKGFLHAQESVEWPLAVELKDRLSVGGITSEALVGNDVLTGIIAFGRAVPEEEAVLEGCSVHMSFCCLLCLVYPLLSCISLLFLVFVCGSMGHGLHIEGPPGTQLVAVHVCDVRVSWPLALCAEELPSQVVYPYLDAFFKVWQAIA